jgi:hypothetical protein
LASSTDIGVTNGVWKVAVYYYIDSLQYFGIPHGRRLPTVVGLMRKLASVSASARDRPGKRHDAGVNDKPWRATGSRSVDIDARTTPIATSPA